MRNGEFNTHVSHLSALSTVSRSPKYSIRSRCGLGALQSRQISPGPGNYVIPSTFRPRSLSNSSSYDSGSKTRINRNRSVDVPGPGTYRPCSSNSVPSCTFARAQRDVSYIKTNEIPGPGAYGSTANPNMAPAYTFRGKYGNIFDGPSRSVSPSPTAYTIVSKEMTPRWTFSSTKRGGIIKQNSHEVSIPGPGQYELGRPDLVLKKGPSFSMKTRHVGKPLIGSNNCGVVYTQFDT